MPVLLSNREQTAIFWLKICQILVKFAIKHYNRSNFLWTTRLSLQLRHFVPMEHFYENQTRPCRFCWRIGINRL